MASPVSDELITVTQSLMLQRGYGGTGVDDICRQAGVSKGAFYHHFSGKEALAIAALDDFFRKSMEKLASIDVSRAPPDMQFLTFLDELATRGDSIWRAGCLMGGLSAEMAEASTGLQQHVSKLFNQIAQTLKPMAKSFTDSLGDHSMTGASLAEHFLVVVEGAIILSRAHRDPERINKAIACFAQQLRWLKPASRS